MFKLAVAILIGAALLSVLTPIDVIRCTPDRSCVIEHRLAGVYTLSTEKASSLTTASVVSKEHYDPTADSPVRHWRYQVLVTGSHGSVSTYQKSMSVPSNATVRDSVQQYLTSPNGRIFSMLQMEAGAIVPVLLLLAIQLVRLAFRKKEV